MSINLTKGQRTDINLRHIGIGLGWDPNTASSSSEFDLDSSVFIVGDSGKLLSNEHFIYYNNLCSPCGAVTNGGDNRTGEGDGDDESITINLELIDARATEIVIGVSIHEYQERRQNFGQVRNSFIRIYNLQGNQEICKYELDEDFSIESAVEFGRLYRRGAQWKFEATGRGYQGGLQALLNRYLGT